MLAAASRHWPTYSAGAANAWLLLVTSKPPSWSHVLLRWTDEQPVLGEPHLGFFYPDPLGFWNEVRRWTLQLVSNGCSGWGMPEALATSALIHTSGGDGPSFEAVERVTRPHVVIFLDESAWCRAGVVLDGPAEHHHIVDPYRRGQVYEGFWGRTATGTVVGKSPQHPATHRLYRAADIDAFLRSAPAGRARRAPVPGHGSR